MTALRTGPHLKHCHVYDGLHCACQEGASVTDALSLIDQALNIPSAGWIVRERERALRSRVSALGLPPHTMGGYQTKGCRVCGGTMIKTYEDDGTGKKTTQWVCANLDCGRVE